MKITPDLYGKLNELGQEMIDPRPMEINVTPKTVSVRDEVRRLLRTELAHQALEQGFESFEESQDFDIDDEELEPDTPYTLAEDEYPLQGHETVNDQKERLAEEPEPALGRGEAEPDPAKTSEADEKKVDTKTVAS